MLEIVLRVLFLFAQQSAPPEPPKPSAVAPQPAQERRTDLNLLGATDSAAGESRRNENVQFNLIDNNALKYLNLRLGTKRHHDHRIHTGEEILRRRVRQLTPSDKSISTRSGSAPR